MTPEEIKAIFDKMQTYIEGMAEGYGYDQSGGYDEYVTGAGMCIKKMAVLFGIDSAPYGTPAVDQE